MSKYGLWQISEEEPVKLPESSIDLERHLEDWIEKDPSLLLPGGWNIVCRQMTLEGGRLDLLALDPQGQWVVIELKAGLLDINVVTQGLYYAAQIDKMSYEQLEAKVHLYLERRGTTLKALLDQRGITEEQQKNGREVQVVFVGTRRTSGIDTMLEFIVKKKIFPVTVVIFEVYQLPTGQRILLRELSEADLTPPLPAAKPINDTASLEKLQKAADKTGIGTEFDLLVQAAQDLGFYIRPFVGSVMLTSPKNKTITLITASCYRKPLRAWISPKAFPLFYPVTEEQSLELLGPEGWRQFDLAAIKQFVENMKTLLTEKDIPE